MKKRGSLKVSQVILCCVIAVFLVPALFFSSHIIGDELEAYIRQTLDEISTQNVNSIQSKVEDDMLLLGEISDRVRCDKSFDSIMAGMKTAAEAYGFKRMGVIGRDGIAHTPGSEKLDIANEDYIVRAFAGENTVSDILSDVVDGRNIFIFSVPIYDMAEENIDGVLFAVCDTENFRSHLLVSAFGGEEYTYIVKSDGTTVIDSEHPEAYQNMTNTFLAMETVGDNKKVSEQMRKEMAVGKDGCLKFENKGQSKYINYAPLGINDWYILSVVPADIMDGSRFRTMLVVYIIFALIVAVALLFVAIMIKSEKVKKKELEQILYVDGLTGGISYAKFCKDVNERLSKRLDKEEKAACVMADLENFSLINNLYGTEEGNKAVLISYRALEEAVGENGLLTRKTEDKFYALVFFREEKELYKKFSHFMNQLKAAKDVSGNEYIINPTIGVYIADDSGETAETITNNATIAHDAADRSGERVSFYNEAQKDRLIADKFLEDRMELAHKNHEFIPYFQPKYSAVTGEICGAEALVRWKNPDGSITPPGKFIPLAESNGFIRILDRDIFTAVCEFQRNLLDSQGVCVPISVNVSRQLMYEQNFASDYIETLRKYDLSPDLVELEITESVLFDDYSVFRNIIDILRENGFKILMDDFGTGYSSLMMLGSVPIDNLKLDKSFIDSYEEDKGRKIIVSVIELAKSLDLPLTAEGVETRDQYDFLKSMGCNIIQGFYFSKPVPGDDFKQMLVSNAAS